MQRPAGAEREDGMNLVFSYAECLAAMLAEDWRVLENDLDRIIFAKGDDRATLHTQHLHTVKGSGGFEVVVASEGIEFARMIDSPNAYGYCRLRAIPTQKGWIAHKPTPKEQEQEAHAQF